MLGGLNMIKKIITSTLIIVILSSSGAMVYADPISNANIAGVEEIQVKNKELEIISPRINSSGFILPSKDLLISVKVLKESSVFLSVYKIVEENEEVIFGPEYVKSGENLKIYNAYIKDIKPGNYKMEFTKENEEVPFIVKRFTLLEKDKSIEKPNLLHMKITDFMLGL